MRCTRNIINLLININVNYINKIIFLFKMYTSKPLYVNYINHINKFKIN